MAFAAALALASALDLCAHAPAHAAPPHAPGRTITLPRRPTLARPPAIPIRLSSPVRAPALDPFRLEDALTLAAFSELTWSRDGRRLAFVVTSIDTAENASNADLYLADLERGDVARLTRHPTGDVSPTFSPSGDTLAFVSTRGTGDEAKPTIMLMSLHGGEPWALGSFDESIGEVRWSPDGRTLAYVITDTLPKQAREWRKKKWDQVVEDERPQYPALWVYDLATGATRRLTSGPHHVWNVRWSPDSRALAFLVSPTGKPDDGNRVEIAIIAAAGGPPRTLPGIGDSFAWSPDGRWIAWAAGSDRAKYVDKSELWVASAAGGAPVNLTAAFDEGGSTPAWNPASDTLFFHVARGASTCIAAVARRGGEVAVGFDRLGQAGTPVAAANGRTAWVQSRADAPTEVWVAEHPRLSGRPLTRLNAAVSQRSLGATRTVSWTSSDGVRVEGVLIRPPGAPERRALKTLVMVHGGPYGERNDLGFQALPQYFAAHGYQVFMPNFRSSAGYGAAFMVRTRADWGGQDWRDVESGVDSLVKWGLADPVRLGLYGRSYGGYLTAWGITQTTRYQAACVFAGAVDLAAHYGQSDVQRYRAYDFEGAPWETVDKWRAASPMTYITRVKTPTLIQIGENDARVPYPQGQQLYRALLALSVPVEFVHYPREGHQLREPRHRADLMMRMLAWWEKWIR